MSTQEIIYISTFDIFHGRWCRQIQIPQLGVMVDASEGSKFDDFARWLKLEPFRLGPHDIGFMMPEDSEWLKTYKAKQR